MGTACCASKPNNGDDLREAVEDSGKRRKTPHPKAEKGGI